MSILAQEETRTKRTLWQLSQDAQALNDLLETSFGDSDGVVTDADIAAIDEWLEEASENLDAKLEGYVHIIKQTEADAASLDAQVKALNEMAAIERRARDARQNKAKTLKNRILWFFQSHGITKHAAGPYTVAVANNGGKAPLVVDDNVDPLAIPDRFITRVLDETAVREYLESGGKLEWARLGERGQSIRIR